MSIESIIKDLKNIKRLQQKLEEHDVKFKMNCHEKHVIELDDSETHEANEIELQVNEPQVSKDIFKYSEKEGIPLSNRVDNTNKDDEEEQIIF